MSKRGPKPGSGRLQAERDALRLELGTVAGRGRAGARRSTAQSRVEAATQALAAYVAIHGRDQADSSGAEEAVASAVGRPALPALAEAIRQLNL